MKTLIIFLSLLVISSVNADEVCGKIEEIKLVKPSLISYNSGYKVTLGTTFNNGQKAFFEIPVGLDREIRYTSCLGAQELVFSALTNNLTVCYTGGGGGGDCSERLKIKR